MEERIRLGFGLLDLPEGVEEHNGDHAERRRDRHGVMGSLVGVGDLEPFGALEEQQPGAEIEGERDGNGKDDQLQPLEAQDHEESRGRGEVLNVKAGVAAEIGGQQEDAGEFRDKDHGRPDQFAIPMQEGDGQRDCRHDQIDDDDRLPGLEIQEHLLDGIDEREKRDHVRGDIHDLETAPHVQRVGFGAIRR